MDYEEYFRSRLASLMNQEGICATKLSGILGFGKNYISKILTGENTPKFKDFLKICEYFGITPEEFFDVETKCPKEAKRMRSLIGELGRKDIDIIMPVIERFTR